MKSVFVVLITLMAAQVFAAGAMEYKCKGVNKVNRSVVEFDVTYSDYEGSVGFTNQSVSITKIGHEDVKNPVYLQMFGAQAKNNCKTSTLGEVYMSSKISGFSMSSNDKEQEGEVTTFKFSCGNLALDIVGVCSLN